MLCIVLVMIVILSVYEAVGGHQLDLILRSVHDNSLLHVLIKSIVIKVNEIDNNTSCPP